MVGTTLGHYRLLKPLGSGGMGEVYLAEDLTLNRQVALKVLPPDTTGSAATRRERFALEARAVAALDHPNIVTIHSLEEANGTEFITMEVVRGRTLAESISKHGMRLGDLLSVAIPIADAVSAAHQHGILHRDLKPSNVMVTDEGRVKVLDFGLAKLKERQGAFADGVTSTESRVVRDGAATTGVGLPITGEGRVVGTVAYMSPEQAEGRPVDFRSDIFSLGVMLYEMATGSRPFKGDSAASICAAILRETPRPANEVNPRVPKELGRAIRRCLNKDREHRYQSAKDLRNDLEELKQESDSGELVAVDGPRGEARARRSLGTWILRAAAVIALVGAALLVDHWLSGPGRPRPADVASTFTQLTYQEGLKTWPSLSPDGKWFVYTVTGATGSADIFLQSVGGRNAINLTRDSPLADTQPSFSPNGEQIVFRSDRQGGGIFVMGRTGESVRRVTDAGYDPAWSPSGLEIAYSTVSSDQDPYIRRGKGELWVVTLATGQKRRIFEGDAMQPRWSSHGTRIAFWGLPPGGAQRDIWTVPARGGPPVAVTNDAALDWNPVWSPTDGTLYFSSDRGGTLNVWRVQVDETTGKVLSAPQSVTTPSAWVGHMSLSADGRLLAYVGFLPDSNIQRFDFDETAAEVRGGATRVTTGAPAKDSEHLSPDGEWLVFRTYPQREDLVICRADGSDARQVTDDAARDRAPQWSPDGTRIAFTSDRSGTYQIWTIRPDGSGLQQLSEAPAGVSPNHPTWSPDGRRLAFSNVTANAVWIFDVRRAWRDQRPELLPALAGDGSVFVVKSWSPDGRRLAGTLGQRLALYSLETRTYEVLADQSGLPCWLNDSRRLLYPVGNRVRVIDTTTRVSRDVVATDPGSAVVYPSVSRDGRYLFLTRRAWDSNVWLATLTR